MLIIACAVSFTSPSFAKQDEIKSNGYDILADVFLRPISFVGMISGAGGFAVLSPMAAIASIPSLDGDIFKDLADTFIVKPYKYTFLRPVGDYTYKEGLKSNQITQSLRSPNMIIDK